MEYGFCLRGLPDQRCDDVSCGRKANTPEFLCNYTKVGYMVRAKNEQITDVADCLSSYSSNPYPGLSSGASERLRTGSAQGFLKFMVPEKKQIASIVRE